MSLFRARARQHQMIGVEVADSGVAFAHIQRVAGQLPRLEHAEFLPEDDSDPAQRLRERLSKLGLGGLYANAVIPSDAYQLLLGDAPDVPAEELNEALRWRIKDLVNFPVADAVIDAFLLPESCTRGGARLAYVVAARRERVQSLVDTLAETPLKLNAIEIPELALANLLEACCDTSRGAAIVDLYAGGGSVQLVREGQLYLARRFKLNFGGGLLDDIPAEAFVLELQRSLDYFERQMRQPPPQQIVLNGENVTEDKLDPTFADALPARVSLLPWEQGLNVHESIDEATLNLCSHAIGAALREGGGR